jgi:hypothetical protein
MDAMSLAGFLEESLDGGGTISLRAFAESLERRGLHEFSRAARALADVVRPEAMNVEQTDPWI